MIFPENRCTLFRITPGLGLASRKFSSTRQQNPCECRKPGILRIEFSLVSAMFAPKADRGLPIDPSIGNRFGEGRETWQSRQ
jgi:hypothetical protein